MASEPKTVHQLIRENKVTLTAAVAVMAAVPVPAVPAVTQRTQNIPPSETRLCAELQESAAGRQNRSSVENLGLRTDNLIFFLFVSSGKNSIPI